MCIVVEAGQRMANSVHQTRIVLSSFPGSDLETHRDCAILGGSHRFFTCQLASMDGGGRAYELCDKLCMEALPG